MRNTSISDDNRYPMYCYIAAKNDEEFKTFKRNPVYTAILEHTTPEQGRDYIELIFRNAELHLSERDWKYFLRNDSIGNPRTAQYNFGEAQIICSPTTLRYIKVLSDISKLFPSNMTSGGGIRNWYRIWRSV